MATSKQMTDSINLSGLFFEEYCKDILTKERRFNALKSEYVFSYFPEDDKNSVINGTADFVGLDSSISFSNDVVMYAVECKKVDPTNKIWVFQESTEDKRKTSEDDPFYLISGSSVPGGYKKYANRQIRSSFTYQNVRVAYKGFELRDSDASLNRNGELKIYSALSQANKALTALMMQNMTMKRLLNLGNNPEGIKTFYIPMVLTNAELNVLRYDAKDVDPSKGQISNDKVTYEKVDWLWYESPLNSYEQVSLEAETGSVVKPVKRLVGIVNIAGVDSFLEMVRDKVD